MAFLAFDLDQRCVDRSREARVVQLDPVILAARTWDFFFHGAKLDVGAREDLEVGGLVRGALGRTIFAFTVPRARVLTVPTKPLPFTVKLPMVAMFVSSFVSRAATIATSMAFVNRRRSGRTRRATTQ